ncbi:hypothetical protein C8J56DRAFT_907098 [Mycena floridula]|nr:hypothetical protein C8J56DRAFT_907098 [Mycena floridula]
MMQQRIKRIRDQTQIQQITPGSCYGPHVDLSGTSPWKGQDNQAPVTKHCITSQVKPEPLQYLPSQYSTCQVSVVLSESAGTTAAPAESIHNHQRTFAEPAQPDSIPVLGRDDKAFAASLDETKLKLAHSQLRAQIKNQKKLFRKKKTLQTESKVFESIVNLEALDMYNDEYLWISLRKVSVTHQLALTSSLTHKALLKKLETVSSPATTRTGLLLQTDQGKGGKHESFLIILGVYSALEIWVKGDLPFEGGFNGRMRRYVNDFLFPKLNIVGKISESTAIRWLKKLGFHLSCVQKGVFCYEYVETDCSKEVPPDLPPGRKIHYPIFHDETCVHANDQANFVWMREGEQPLQDKSRGHIVHVSDFILEHCTNYDPSWDMPQLIVQVKDAIKIPNIKYPDGVAVFIFDCSSAHEAFASDALLAHKMNRGSGGKQPKMCDTVITSTNLSQSMVFPANYTRTDKDGSSLAGKPKGMEQVLHEWGLLAALEAKHKKVLGVCAKCKMTQAAREKAMKEAKARQDEIEGSGVEGMATRRISEMDEDDEDHSSDCCMQHALLWFQSVLIQSPQLIFTSFSAIVGVIWMHTRLNLKQAAYAVKKYTSHRCIPPKIMMDINILNRSATS